MKDRWLSGTILFQGIFYVVTGLWPIVDVKSFTAVVGPKPDFLQLIVTASLIVAIGIVLLLGFKRLDKSVISLSFFSAATFVILDIVFQQSLRKIFLVDLVLESTIALIVLIKARSHE